MHKLLLSHDQNSYLIGAVIHHSSCQANFRRQLIISLHWYACISMNTHCYVIYHISSGTDWWALSNVSLIGQICLVIYEILANKDFIVTDDLISQLFVFAFVHSTYVQIALIWGFIIQLSLWKSVYWLWRYKLNKVCDIFIYFIQCPFQTNLGNFSSSVIAI